MRSHFRVSAFIRRLVTATALLLILEAMALEATALGDTGVPQPAYGYRSHDRLDLADLGYVGGLLIDDEGRLWIAVESELRRYDPDGTSESIAPFEPTVFGSFLVAAPAGDAILFGESSEGGIYRVPSSGGAPQLVDRVSFNYDLAFDPAGRGFVSAYIGGQAQKIVLLDEDPANDPFVVVDAIAGFSGPVACDSAGDLFYATATAVPEPQSVVRFRSAQLDAALDGSPLALADGEVVFSGDVTASNMRFLDGRLYVSDLGFNSPLGAGAVYALDPAAAFAATVFVAFPHPERIVSPTHIATLPGTSAFEPGAGPAGGRLAVVYSDFGEIHAVAELTARELYVRGEVNADEELDLSDAVSVLDWLFLGGREPHTPEAADANSDGDHDVSDASYLLNFLFLGGPPPGAPFPDPGLEPPPPPA